MPIFGSRAVQRCRTNVQVNTYKHVYVSIAGRKDGEDVSRQKEDLMPILSSSLVENESFDVRASFCWKNIYSTVMEREKSPYTCAARVPLFWVSPATRSLNSLEAANEHELGSPRPMLGMRWNVRPDTESSFERFLRANCATDIAEKNVFASACVYAILVRLHIYRRCT